MFRLSHRHRSVTVNMSSVTVTVTGTDSSALVSNFFPPIALTGEGEWYVGLLDFTTYNTIPNVIDGKNNEFPVRLESNGGWKTIKLPTGAYEIDNIERYLKKELGGGNISLRPNNNTLKCELFCKYNVDFGQSPNTIGRMLGFTKTRTLEAYITHESDAPVDIIKVNAIQIHTLHSFYPTVEPGFKIVETPSNVIYLPVNVNSIHNITLSIVDQDGDNIDFRGEVITVRLHLKRI